jgi:hypothetical protein
MKKELAVFALALGLASTAPAFAGGEKITPKKHPVKMTDDQMDKVTAGQINIGGGLIDVDVQNVDVVKDVAVNANLAAGVAAAVLGGAGNAVGAAQRAVTFQP